METLSSRLPILMKDEVIPFRDQVAQRTSVVAERNATIHAPTSLLLKQISSERFVHLFPVQKTHVIWSPGGPLTIR
jgi:hypothetical protein